ncbi:MAG: S-adenosylmethionine decarboxylase [Bacteroidota bacterium]
MNSNQPGTHIIATLQTTATELLESFEGCQSVINDLVATFQLSNLGDIYHNFSPAGFTAVVCLSESHIAIHTWPEEGKINLDIYLSNFERNNDGTVQQILDRLVSYFRATITANQILIR